MQCNSKKTHGTHIWNRGQKEYRCSGRKADPRLNQDEFVGTIHMILADRSKVTERIVKVQRTTVGDIIYLENEVGKKYNWGNIISAQRVGG